MRSVHVATQPAAEPLSAADCQAHSRIDGDDLYLSGLIVAARQYAETYCRRALITQTIELRLDVFPAGRELYLERAPVQSITSVAYTDENGTAQTVTDYQTDLYATPPFITPARAESWPSVRDEVPTPVTITYVAGYGDDASDVPQAIRHAMAVLVAHWYEHREPVVTGTIVAPVPLSVRSLLDLYRLPEVR